MVDWLGVKHSVSNSGSRRTSFSWVLKHQFPEGGEVIVPTLTWVSDIASVLHTGFSPIFVTDPRTLGIQLSAVLDKVNDNTRNFLHSCAGL